MKPLLLNGKPFSLASSRPTLEKLKRFLDKLPDNEVLDSTELSRRSSVGNCAITDHAKNPLLSAYRVEVNGRNKRFWGNPRAIKAAKKLIEAGQ